MELCWYRSYVLLLGLLFSNVFRSAVMQTAAEDGSFDASEVTWAHAVNSKDELDRALNGVLDFIEADVSLGRMIENEHGTVIPIMAHPPNAVSDLSLDAFINTVIRRQTGKGIKLDFKSTDVVELALAVLEDHKSQMNFSLWLNADVLPGPINSSTVPVKVDRFLALCHQFFPKATLSIGWTTSWLPQQLLPEILHYEWHQIRQMADVIQCNRHEDNFPSITFPIRGIFAVRSIKEFQWLLGVTPRSSLTVWSSSLDQLKVEDLLQIRAAFPKNRVYYDLLEPLNSTFHKLKLNVQVPNEKDIFPDSKWITITRGQNNQCSTYTYVNNNTIVFGRNASTAVLHTSLFSVDHTHRLKVQGRLKFFVGADQLPIGKQELILTLTDVSLFSKNMTSSAEGNLDLSQSDTGVILDAVNASHLHRFEHNLNDDRTVCHLFSLDTSLSKAFRAWNVPCHAMWLDFEEATKRGIQVVSSRKRLVLPPGPFMFGFLSSGDGHAVVYDLEIVGENVSALSRASVISVTFGLFSFVLSVVIATMIM